jgi:hypothetical protein
MSKEKMFSPGEVAFVKNVIKKRVGIDFSELFDSYSRNQNFFKLRGAKKATEVALINDILDEGRLQLGAGANFEELIIAGASSMAKLLGLQ